MDTIGSIVKDHRLFTVSAMLTVAEAVRFMTEKNIGAVPVVDNNRLTGVFSERDVITRVVAKGLDPEKILTRDVMTSRIVVAQSDESIDVCRIKMQKAHCRHLPVVTGETLVGFVSLRDLLMLDLSEKEESLDYLHSYIYTVPPGMTKKYGAH